MNRLQKKCIIISAGFHLLLALIVVIGPAFASSKSETIDLPVIDFIPIVTTDDKVSGGGNPNGRLPEPPPQAAPPEPKQAAPPEPVKPPEPRATREPDSLEPAKNNKREIKVSKTLVDRDPAQKARDAAAAREKQVADARRRTAAVREAVAGMRSELSSGTAIELKGPGGGGVPYANFLQAVKSRYDEAWVVPDGVTDQSAIVAVSVTIARSGTVVGSRITEASGNSEVDRSVQATLDRVKFAAPLPENSTEAQRTVTLKFSVKAKLSG